jgi:uncharacterized protein
LETATIYPHQPRNDWQGSLATLARMVVQHSVELISIGNGTASRESDKLAAEVIKLVAAKMPDRKLSKIVVSEAGASVYSASALAAAEFPELDVSLRGAVSIARRLQDPLAELVKIDPKSIGVGQYQHDVNQRALARSLDATVEDCVNAVGVDVNTASSPLLARVSGLNNVTAKNMSNFATPTARLGIGKQFVRCHVWVTRPSSRLQDSCASMTATIRSIAQRYILRRIRWSSESWGGSVRASLT